MTLGSTTQVFNDSVGLADKDDLYRVAIGSRSSFNLQLSGIRRGANVDVELFSLKGAKAAVLRRIGRINFSNLRASDIRRYLTRLGRSARPGRNNESLNLTLDAGEFYVRVLRRNGDSSYSLSLSATPENTGGTGGIPGNTPTPTPGVTPTPTPTPGGTPTPSQFAPTWIRQLGSSANDYGYGIAFSGSNVLVAGTTEGTLPNGGQNNAGGSDNFVAQYNSDGTPTPLFVRQFGGATSERIFDIEVDSSGNYYVAGVTINTSSGPIPVVNGFVTKYNSAGAIQWNQPIDTDTNQFDRKADVASSLTLDSQGNVFVAGFVGGFPGITPARAFVSKFNGATGAAITTFGNDGRAEFAGSTSASEAASGVAVDADGNVYITGVTNATLGTDLNNPFTGGDAFVVKYNGSTGAPIWAPQILSSAGQDYARGIAIAGSNVYITGDTTGALSGQTNAGGTDGFLAQFTQTNNGTTVSQGWLRQFGTTGLDESQGVTTDSTGNVYITGETNSALFGGSPAGDSDAFIAKFDSTGTRLASTLLGTAQADESYNIRLDGSGNVYVVGQTQGNLGGAGSHQGSYDVWLAKYAAF
ncbi:MAG: SBBP repeat-containing protein [Oculatellaceae cyanobacterium bins.114]|nr:SBBP repeat-containing protein [Oculatellaceae cyanobacterium bins.114]